MIDTHSPVELQLFRVYRIEKNSLHEKRLFKQYESKQIRNGWFGLDMADIHEIDRYMTKNKGVRILDNIKKVLKGNQGLKMNFKPDNDDPLDQYLEKLEKSVEQLKRALEGRDTL